MPYSRFPADKRAALDPWDAEALAAGEANPPPKEGDPALLMQIRRMYAEADPGFRTLNPATFANLLNPDQMGQLAGWLDDVRQNGANGPTPDQIKAHRVLAAADDAAAGAVAAQGVAGADTPRSVEAAPDAPGPAAMDTVARAEDGLGRGPAPGSLFNNGVYYRGTDDPTMQRAAVRTAAPRPQQPPAARRSTPEYDRAAPPVRGKASPLEVLAARLGVHNDYYKRQKAFADSVKALKPSPADMQQMQASMRQIEAEKRAKASQVPTFTSGLSLAKVRTMTRNRMTRDDLVIPLLRKMAAAGIVNPYEQAALLAQVMVETGDMTTVDEDMNKYTEANIRSYWGSRFPNKADIKKLVHHPQQLAERVYGGRNGNNQPGDGYKYRRGGMIQTTGKANYAAAGYDQNPDLIRTAQGAAKAAIIYWQTHKLGAVSGHALTRKQFDGVTSAVNSQMLDADKRWRAYQRAKHVLGVP